MPQAIPQSLTRAAVLQALADLDAGVEHPFGPPTGYEPFQPWHAYDLDQNFRLRELDSDPLLILDEIECP
jgi:hypothetical protein